MRYNTTTRRPEAGSRGANQYGDYVVRYASPKQVGFLRSLLASRDYGVLSGSGADLISSVIEAIPSGHVSLRVASSAIDLLLTLPVVADTPRPASEKQISYVKSLLATRAIPDISQALWDGVVVEDLTAAQASRAIDTLSSYPRRAESQDEPQDGIYIDETTDRIYKVYKMVHGSGRQGVKVLESRGDTSGQFVYQGLAVRNLPKTARRMTLDEAKEYGRIYGFCIRCGATLTDEMSISEGIGPVCGQRWV